MDTIVNYYSHLPWLELTAVVLSLAYVWLAAKANQWCWPAAFFSTAIYTVIFYDVALLMDSLLNVFYLIMAVYGWFSWRRGRLFNDVNILENMNIPENTNTPDTAKNNQYNNLHHNERQVISWSLKQHSVIVLCLACVSLIVGYFMASYTQAAFPYIDAATTVYAIFATFLVTQKVLENWLYWLVIDVVSIYVYLEKGLQPTAFLFALYVCFALYGYWQWLMAYKKQFNTVGNSTELNNETLS